MNWKERIERWFSITSELLTTNNEMDDKKNNFVLKGTKTHKRWIFGIKIKNKKEIINQSFNDEKDKSSIGFEK